MKVRRENFLRVLESVSPGLKVGGSDQSGCFAFVGGVVRTYNDDVACVAPSGLGKDVYGAVAAERLLNMLRKLPDDDIDVGVKDAHLVLRGKSSRKSGHRLESAVSMPELDEAPEGWAPLPADFADAVGMVHRCASTSSDPQDYQSVCVNLHPEWLEAGDDHQFCRWNTPLPLSAATLVRASALSKLPALGVTEVAETGGWLHFRGAGGLTYSCRRTLDEYPSETFDQIFEMAGDTIQLPKGLSEAAQRAGEWSAENGDRDFVSVKITHERGGLLWVESTSVGGYYQEPKRILWSGPEFSFMIGPKLLADLVQKHNEFVLSPDRLKVGGEKWLYVCCLGVPQGAPEAEGQEFGAADEFNEFAAAGEGVE